MKSAAIWKYNNLITFHSLILTALIALVSVMGLLFPERIYREEEIIMMFVPNDILNLMLGVPVLLITMFLTRKRKLVGLLCFPGTLFYIIYIYTAYLIGLKLNLLFVPYLVLVVLSLITLFILITHIDHLQIAAVMREHLPAKAGGYIIFTIACLILVYQVWSILRSFMNHLPIDRITLAQWIDDLAVGTPALMITALWLIRRRAVGTMAGTATLLALTMLFIGLIPVMIMEGIMSGTPAKTLDLVIIAVSSMICVIPFLLFTRGIMRAQAPEGPRKMK